MRLLIVGKLQGQIGAASAIARAKGAKVSHLETVEAALDALRNGYGADVLMVEVKQDIKYLVSQLELERIHVPVVACGIESDSQAAVKAIKAGAKEYIPLPPDEELIAAVLEAITEESHALIFDAPAMHQVIKLADQIAGSDASVMITGESGTGKEVIARHIHQKSKRADHPLISVNCAAIPENLLESELFGHEKGAFTGAVARRIGKFEEANNGTLLLDEISEMDIRLQAKLLRAIQEQVIDRVGGNKPVKINIRILATSNRDLKEAVKQGTFREDLLFRLNVISIHMPPLRERKSDIPKLAVHFANKYAKANGLPERAITDTAISKLEHYDWPGNVRELENIMHRAILIAQGSTVDADAIALQGSASTSQLREDIPASFNTTAAARKNDMVGRTVESVERDLIIDTLHHCLGNRTHAANILGISIRTLRNKLKLYNQLGYYVPGEERRTASPAQA